MDVEVPKEAVVDGVWGGGAAQASIAAWMQTKIGAEIVEVPFAAFGFVDGGKLVGGCYFHSLRDGDCKDITVAVVLEPEIAEHPVAFRTAIARVLSYPFRDLDLPRVSAEIDMSNARSIDLAQRFGFVQEGTKKHAGSNGGDVGIFGLYRDSCPYWRA